MSISNKDVAYGVIDFLRNSITKKEIEEEYVESIDVAIDCIADAFQVDKELHSSVVAEKFGGLSLKGILNESTKVEKAEKPEKGKETTKKTADPEAKAKADSLKTEGNRALVGKNFKEAIAKYTEAIKLDSENAVYYSNRAAAYSSDSQHERAVEDAEKALQIDPNFSKAYSRLGLAKYALGDATAAMKAYEKGLEVEGDKKSEAMAKGYETAKKRVEEELQKSISPSNSEKEASSEAGENTPSQSTGNAANSGMPDLGSLFGGGQMPSFSEMMNNPQIMQAAQGLMSNPSAMLDLMNNPQIRQMSESLGGGGNGGGPNFSELMNNPMLRNLASLFMGGGNNNNSLSN